MCGWPLAIGHLASSCMLLRLWAAPVGSARQLLSYNNNQQWQQVAFSKLAPPAGKSSRMPMLWRARSWILATQPPFGNGRLRLMHAARLAEAGWRRRSSPRWGKDIHK